MYIKFLNTKKPIECTVVPNGNIVTLKFKEKAVINTNGFRCYLDEKCEYDISGTSYENFNTVYRNDDETEKYNGYQLSNDGSVWVKPSFKISFFATNGGTLKGETIQNAYRYEELIVPTPIAIEDYKFDKWSSEIPISGEIKKDEIYTALFVSTKPIPEPTPQEPTIEERIVALEENNIMLTETVDSILTDVIPSLM